MSAADRAEEMPAADRMPGAPHPAETVRLFGQARAERAFLAALAEGRLHHAWLLRGPKGIGKATLAYRIARAVLADAGGGAAGASPLDWPAGCPVGRRIRAGSEPRLRVLRRTVNEKTGKPFTAIRIEEVREVRRFFELSIPDGGWRVVLVDAADEMTLPAMNAFLKMLEEPPERTLMLLVAHARGAVLPTVRSRCRTLDLDPLGAEDLAAALAGVVGVGGEGEGAALRGAPQEAEALAELSGGSVGRALALLEGGGLALYAEIVGLFEGARIDRGRLAALAERVSGRDRETVFPLVCDLALVLLGRLGRAGVLGPPATAAAEGEAGLMARAAATPGAARLWAEAASRLGAVGRHARAVNLDPAQTILDMFLDLDETLGQATGAR